MLQRPVGYRPEGGDLQRAPFSLRQAWRSVSNALNEAVKHLVRPICTILSRMSVLHVRSCALEKSTSMSTVGYFSSSPSLIRRVRLTVRYIGDVLAEDELVLCQQVDQLPQQGSQRRAALRGGSGGVCGDVVVDTSWPDEWPSMERGDVFGLAPNSSRKGTSNSLGASAAAYCISFWKRPRPGL